jgi:hypothetical protein
VSAGGCPIPEKFPSDHDEIVTKYAGVRRVLTKKKIYTSKSFREISSYHFGPLLDK